MPTPTPTAGVMLTRGRWKAFEPCANREHAEEALAVLRDRYPDWWVPAPTLAEGAPAPKTPPTRELLIEFGHDVRGQFVVAEVLERVPLVAGGD